MESGADIMCDFKNKSHNVGKIISSDTEAFWLHRCLFIKWRDPTLVKKSLLIRLIHCLSWFSRYYKDRSCYDLSEEAQRCHGHRNPPTSSSTGADNYQTTKEMSSWPIFRKPVQRRGRFSKKWSSAIRPLSIWAETVLCQPRWKSVGLESIFKMTHWWRRMQALFKKIAGGTWNLFLTVRTWKAVWGSWYSNHHRYQSSDVAVNFPLSAQHNITQTKEQ